MEYKDVLTYLTSRDMTMSRYEREDFDKFVKKINLTLNVPFIHITGSNGKGSTAHYLYKIYEAKGLKVALFSKPYFYQVNEMMEINDKTISNEDFARIFTLHESEIKESNLSSFEIETYIAFTYFNEQKVDLAIIEAGMGGLTDSTNLVTNKPLLSIITTVSLEHTSFLGRTVSEIAENKAGIIKPKCPCLVGKLVDSALTTIRDIANKIDAPFHVVDDYHLEHYASPYFRFDYRPYRDLAILTPASYQLMNASLAIEATKILGDHFPMDEFSLRKGLLSSPLPCRMERHHNVILDGAHNPEAMSALVKCLENLSIGKKIHVLFASFKDKNIAVEFPIIANVVSDITLTTFDNKRARDEEDYFLYEADYPFRPDYKMALTDLLAKYPDDYIVVTGSLTFTSIVREYVIDTLKL
jgi:dihydrofolate synthase/folylpolyglutamate synthase